MKFAVVTDIHIGKYSKFRSIFRKNTLYSKKSLRKFVKKMNKFDKPDFVINCGDLLEDINERKDKKNFIAGIKILSKLNCPIFHVVGNHDQRNLSEAFIKKTLGQKELYYAIDLENYRLIFLYTKQEFHANGSLKEPYITVEQLSWLKQKANTSKDLIIFSHASLIPINTSGNFWFENDSSSSYIKNYNDFKQCVRTSNLKMAINGHLHWNKLVKQDGVAYISIQSLVENITGKTKGPPANAYAIVDIKDQAAFIDVHGWGGVKYHLNI